MKASCVILTVMLTLLVSASSVLGLQLITNGNFETGDLTGWSIGGDFPVVGAVAVPNIFPGHPELGSWVGLIGPPLAIPYFPQAIGTAYLYQNFVIPAGMTDLAVSIDFMPWSVDSYAFDYVWVEILYDGNLYYQSWGGTQGGVLESPGWQRYSNYFDISGVTTDMNCTVKFGVTTTFDVLYSTGFNIDNVSVGAVPEPATVLLLGGGLVGMGLLRAVRRRKK